MVRLGLCCKFAEQPIRFRTTTASSLLRLSRRDALRKVADLCLANAAALREALMFCAGHGIGAFRINSQILPVKTHPEAGYAVEDLPDAECIKRDFRACGRLAARLGIRTLFHPDQFVVLSSVDAGTTGRSLAEIEYQAEVAEWVGADVINLHGGGAYGNKSAALRRVAAHVDMLSARARTRLTLENDDRVYSPGDLLPLCRSMEVPLVYDVHHHRCLGDGLSAEAATRAAIETWAREPVFHLSSPKHGWTGGRMSYHHDVIRLRDWPACWNALDVTVEVEAKAKERAVVRLRRALARRRVELFTPGAGSARSARRSPRRRGLRAR